MEPSGESIDQLNTLLLSAVRQGDLNSLEKYLSSVADSAVYLNRVYDEINTQKCTLLTIACLNQQFDVIKFLLDRFQPDLEVLNDIFIQDGNSNRQLFINVSVLWTAACVNNFDIVKLLVEHGANVNHCTKTNSTPLRGACYNGNLEMVRYLIDNGADVRIAKENNDTNLMVSVCRKHMSIIAYLVDELKCDVNECDKNGRSALYDAVNCGSIEVLKFLFERGARNFRATTGDQMSPLMWAAEKRRVDLMQIIATHCSLLERIEAEELLGSAFVCSSHGERTLDQSFEHFSRTLQLRLAHHLPKAMNLNTSTIFNNQHECQTVDELKVIWSNFDRMYIEALLVRERLLGVTNREYRHSLSYRGAILADNKLYDEAIAYWIYELSLCQAHAISIDVGHLRHFISLFSGMICQVKPIPMGAFFTVMTTTMEVLEHDRQNYNYNLSSLLYLVTIASKLYKDNFLSTVDCKVFHHLLRSIHQLNCIDKNSGMSLLHLSVDDHTVVDDYHIKRTCKYPCLATVQMLLQSGAIVDTFDARRNTPLHLIASSKSVHNESILNLLCNYGAHLDYTNTSGLRPFDLATNSEIKQALRRRMKPSLKCLCAQLIRLKNVAFYEQLSTSLANFVDKH